MARPRRTYPDVVVTGASSGIGAAFAVQLASRGTRRIELVARRAARLDDLARALHDTHGVECEVHAGDLTQRETIDALSDRLRARPPDLLVQAAGRGLYGPFASAPPGPLVEMIDLNVRALVQLSHVYVRAALDRGRGAMLLVASTAGWTPVPYQAVYAATKTFEVHFGEALYEELRGTRVIVRTLCPGFTETEFASAAGLPRSVVLQQGVRADDVAVTGLVALERSAPLAFHGRVTAAAGFVARVAPRRLVRRVVGRWMERGLTARTRT